VGDGRDDGDFAAGGAAPYRLLLATQPLRVLRVMWWRTSGR
jgi:hypothetical protein